MWAAQPLLPGTSWTPSTTAPRSFFPHSVQGNYFLPKYSIVWAPTALEITSFYAKHLFSSGGAYLLSFTKSMDPNHVSQEVSFMKPPAYLFLQSSSLLILLP